MDFIDSQHGWAVGDDLYSADATAPVYATADGGLNWTLQTSDYRFASRCRIRELDQWRHREFGGARLPHHQWRIGWT